MSLLGATVKVGGVNATNVVATLTSVTCKTPAGAAGPKDVQVTTSFGTATAPGAFTHMAAPTISTVTPTSGPAAGGTSITITGTRDGQRITVTGTATGLTGKTLRPWIRFSGQSAYSEGTAVITPTANGTFTWSRKTSKRASVYIAHEATKSNTVSIPAR
jgi:hypothetical protein